MNKKNINIMKYEKGIKYVNCDYYIEIHCQKNLSEI